MKIAVISDTHMPKKAKQIPSSLLKGITGVDMIIHAGDWTTIELYDVLGKIAPVEGVFGNIDPIELQKFFPEKKVLVLQGFKIGVVHGHVGKKKTTPERAKEAFREELLDIIIFGHSHIPYKKQSEKTLLFNPGSPTDKRFQEKFSYGIIELDDTIRAEHYFF